MSCQITTNAFEFQLAVSQKNLSAVQEIWNECFRNYSLNIFSLKRFIWSFTRLGDLKSAYDALQQMVVLAIRGSTSFYSTEGNLCFSRLDIPIPSKHESKIFYLTKLDNDGSNKDQASVFSVKVRETADVQVRMSNPFESKPVMKALRWSFNDVISACAYLNNNGLAEPLLAQV